jgi:K+-transporting ATPase KdpF subunit
MSIENAFALVVVTGLLAYLVAALIFPRHF